VVEFFYVLLKNTSIIIMYIIEMVNFNMQLDPNGPHMGIGGYVQKICLLIRIQNVYNVNGHVLSSGLEYTCHVSLWEELVDTQCKCMIL